MADTGDWVYMQRCLELAQRAKGHTAPNPMVGAVLVHNGLIISEGWHHHYGADHAEVNCLNNVTEKDKNLLPECTMYVNLEPCAHYGITPPCAVRLVTDKIKKVVIANTDPFEKVKGAGIEILKAGGVDVETGILEKEGLWVNRRFFCLHSQQRPYIILKWAQTREGFIAPADGSRKQITNEYSTRLVHKWRTEEGAIMVGYRTALNDNPQLTARQWMGKHPLRIALDRKLQLPTTHHLFDETAATWIINEQCETQQGNIHSVQLSFGDRLLTQLLHRLHEGKILSVMVEGGAALLNSFISQGLWDEARVFTGDVTINDGIAAPLLNNAVHAFATLIGTDMLQVSVNKNSPYAYVKGMEL